MSRTAVVGIGLVFALSLGAVAVGAIPTGHGHPFDLRRTGGASPVASSSLGAGEAAVSVSQGSPSTGRTPMSAGGDPPYVVLGAVPVQAGPIDLLYDPGANQMFVADAGSTYVSVYSDATQSVVKNISLLSPEGMAYDPAKGEVFVANWESSFGTGPAPNVSVISDTTDSAIASITVGVRNGFGTPFGAPAFLAYDSAKDRVWATIPENDTVLSILPATNAVGPNISVGSDPVGIAYDSAKGELFVANGLSANVSVISDVTDHVVHSIPVGSDPGWVAYDPTTGDVFVANQVSNNVSVISDSTNQVVATIPVGADPQGVSVGPAGTVVVDNLGSSNVSVISDATDRVVSSLNVGTGPIDSAYDPSSQNVLVADELDNVLWFLAPGTPVTFTESGLPASTSWEVITKEPARFSSLSTNDRTLAGSVQVIAPQGILSFSVGSEFGYLASPGSGTVIVQGAAVTVGITFAAQYQVAFDESGLPVGTNWSVTAGGVTMNTTGSSVVFFLTDGRQGYFIGPVEGYSASPAAGTVVVASGPASVQVTFTAVTPTGPAPPPVQVSVSGYTSADMAAIGVGGAGLALGAVALALALRRRPPS